MKTEIKWGVIFTIAMLLWLALERLTGLHDKYFWLQPFLTNLVIIPAVWIYVLLIREKRRQLGGKITFKQAFISGLLTTVVVTLLVPLAQWLTFKFITPHFFENAINFCVTQQVHTLAYAQAIFNTQSYLRIGMVGALVMGIITSLILAVIMQTKTVKQ